MMTIEEMYRKLLEEARKPDHKLYDAYRAAVVATIDEALEDIPQAVHETVLPFNFRERMDYIHSRPYQYHSIIQLKALHDEFKKKYAAYRIRQHP